MPLTFGSVGDIISVGQTAWKLIQALTDVKGSAAQYQGLIKELRAFERAMLQTVALWQNYDSPDVVTTDTVKEWLDMLRGFQEKVNRKYGRSLGVSGSGNFAKDVSKKLLWLREKEDISEVRNKLSTASRTVTLLTLEAMGKSNKLIESENKFRVQAVHLMLEDAKRRAEGQVVQLKLIEQKIDVQLQRSDFILSNVKDSIASLSQVHFMTIDIKKSLCLFENQMKAQQSTPRGIGTCWQHDPVTLEDACGFQIPIPLETVTSWEIFDLILKERFTNRHGYQKVLRGEFAIEEGSTGRIITRDNNFTTCFRPGQKIDMSMIFFDLNASDARRPHHGVDSSIPAGDMARCNYCPRCGTESEVFPKTRTKCKSCQMWFQRLVEIDEECEVDYSPIEDSASTTRSRSGSKTGKSITSTPADFQRVRLMRILRRERHVETC